MKELIQKWMDKPPMTADEIEIRTWAFVVRSITVMVLVIAFGVLWLIGFEEQTGDLAPIDAVFLEILKAIAFMGVGAMGAISGRKGSTPQEKPQDGQPS
jgi:uncharacterized RDD family membrane protein YckC